VYANGVYIQQVDYLEQNAIIALRITATTAAHIQINYKQK